LETFVGSVLRSGGAGGFGGGGGAAGGVYPADGDPGVNGEAGMMGEVDVGNWEPVWELQSAESH
jgi:hypothetical protein